MLVTEKMRTLIETLTKEEISITCAAINSFGEQVSGETGYPIANEHELPYFQPHFVADCLDTCVLSKRAKPQWNSMLASLHTKFWQLAQELKGG